MWQVLYPNRPKSFYTITNRASRSSMLYEAHWKEMPYSYNVETKFYSNRRRSSPHPSLITKRCPTKHHSVPDQGGWPTNVVLLRLQEKFDRRSHNSIFHVKLLRVCWNVLHELTKLAFIAYSILSFKQRLFMSLQFSSFIAFSSLLPKLTQLRRRRGIKFELWTTSFSFPSQPSNTTRLDGKRIDEHWLKLLCVGVGDSYIWNPMGTGPVNQIQLKSPPKLILELGTFRFEPQPYVCK